MKRPAKNRILSALLALVMVLSMVPAGQATAVGETTATLVTDISALKVDDQIIIANGEYGYALGTNQKSSNREAVTVTVANGVLTYDDTVQVFTLQAGAVEGTWAFSTGSGYLYANGKSKAQGASSNQNYLKTREELDAYASFAISINGNGEASIVAQGDNANRTMQFNNGNSKLFSCYGSASQKGLQIYKVDAAAEGPGESTPEETPEPAASTKYEKVASVADGDVVLLFNPANGKLVSSNKSGYNLAGVDAAPVDGVIATDDESVVWTVGIADGVYTFTQGEKVLGGVSSGTYINPSVDAADGNTGWNVTSANAANNSYYIASTTLTKGDYGYCHLEWYDGIKLYATTSPNEAAYGFVFYKLVKEETQPPVEDPGVSSIAEAIAGAEGTSFTVKGVITALDGKNVYIQDSTGGICLRMNDTPADLALGDTIIGTGSKTDYRGMPQLGSGTYEKSEGLTLAAKETTISALTDGDVCTYVKITGLEVTEVYDSNGAYANPNITLKDATGKTIQIYKAVTTKTDDAWDIQLGDVLDVTAAVGTNNGTLQLRNTVATEISKWNISTIAEALAGETDTEFTVKGVVTLVDGRNVYIQDETDAMCVYMGTASNDIALGDTIIATGKRGAYNGLEQLSGGTYIKSSGLTLAAKETTIGALTTADVAHYITIKGLEVTGVSGTKLTLADEAGNSIVTYNSVLGDTVYAVGDKIDFTGALGIFKTTLQLRNTLATEIVKLGGDTPVDPPVDPPVEPEVKYADKMSALPGDGDTIIIYNSGNAMGAAASGTRLAAVAAAVADNKLPIDEAMAKLLVTVEDGKYIFTLDGKYLTSADGGNGLSFSDTLTDCGKWTAEAATDGTWYLKNVGANHKGNYNQAMEYYNGFTTFGIKETAIYQMELYLVEKAAQNHIITDLSELTDGAKVVIFNPANMKALSQVYDGFYNTGVDVVNTEGVLTGYGFTEIWTVGINADGTYTFSTSDGKKIALGASYSSMPLDEANPNWNVSAAATADCFYIKNSVRGNYMEWYAAKNNWSSFGTIGTNEALFAQQFYLVVKEPTAPPTTGDSLEEGSKVVIYNLSAKGVLAGEGDNQVITNVPALILNEKATAGNGAVVFTVVKNGEYYRFYNETYGYLCSNGTGNNAFYSLEASNDADWTLTKGKRGGYNLESRVAKFNGQYSQFLEYYSDSYKTYSMYNVTDYDIYEFFFYPCTNEKLTGDVVNEPHFVVDPVPDAYIGQDYVLDAQVNAVFGTDSITAGDFPISTDEQGLHITVTAAQVETYKEAGTFDILLKGVDTKGVAFEKTVTVTIKDEPQFGAVSPASGSETGSNKKPVIEAVVTNAGENPVVTMTVNDQTVAAAYADGKITYTPAADLADGRTTVKVTVTRADGKAAEKSWTFTVGKAQYQLYFGQLHSHTTYSDGSGSLTAALEYIKSLPESANVDFVAFTDHSNYFDSKDAANPEQALYDTSKATEASMKLWNEYVNAALDFNASQSDIIAIPGFEMTWSGGPGHMNTFNTPGIVSRNNATLNNKTSDAGMKAYYALLSSPELSNAISQFNHPGSTFGTFSDFAYWDAVIDSRIHLVEVGNGEGQIGAGGYFPSYEYYTMALDKGWHVAPTNNQDNHKGKWGNANDARDVILTDNFSLEGLYQAIRDMRVYSTEDKNLEIYYSVNGKLLGSTIEEVPEKLNISVILADPDSSDTISKVEVIVNSGKVAHTWNDASQLASGELSVTLDPTYSYYYIRVTQGDGDLAVTAPVWVGETLMLGISEVKCGTSTPVTGEELTLTTTLFNSEKAGATVKTLTYAIKGGAVIGTDNTGYTVDPSGTLAIDYKYTPDKAKVTTITVTAIVEQEGVEYIFTKDVELDIENADNLVYVGIDASHYNEYVAGNYKDSMGNFSTLASEYSVRTVQLNTSKDLVEACSNPKYKALILTAPSRRNGNALRDPYLCYSDAEIAAITAFNKAGGMVILAGWSDYYEHYAPFPAEDHMAAQQNKILEALGSSLRIGDDATNDNEFNGGETHRLYFNTYGENVLTQGVEVDPENPHDRLYTEVFSHYGGASVYVNGSSTIPTTVSPVVFGHSGTYSKDSDDDGLGGSSAPKYAYAEGDDRLMVMAYEELPGQGMIIVSGAAFMSNFEVQAQIEDSGSEKNYSNYRICQNILELVNPVKISDIADVQAEAEEGVKFTIEGIVTSNASGYDKDTAFFDCIYLQDATAGINAFPVAGTYQIGDKVRITGTTSSYQGERQIAVDSIQLISQGNTVEAQEVSAQQINDRSVLGSLVTLKGTVVSFEKANGLVQTIMVKDKDGKIARVFIDGYITTSKDVENLAVGCNITVTGCASYDDTFNAPEGPFARIRIRNRADVICTAQTEGPTDPEQPGETTKPEQPGETTKPEQPGETTKPNDTTKPNGTKPDTGDNPGTGDHSSPVLYACMMLISLAVIMGTVILPRRKRNA